MKVLIADDDQVTRRLVRAVLEHNSEVQEAADGGEVIAAVSQAWDEGSPFNCMILDIGMPICDGLDALIAIRNMEDERGVKPENRMHIVMLTGSSAPGDLYDSHMLDSEAYLMKPIDRDRLIRTLKHVGVLQESR